MLTRQRRNIIGKKPLLHAVYAHWYQMIQQAAGGPDGRVLELGAGAGPLKQLMPRAVCTDVVSVPGLDVVCDAECLPFRDRVFTCILMIDVLHHVADPARALQEIDRCLDTGGRVVMIEPANTWWGRTIWNNLHHEPFDPTASEWKTSGSDPLQRANSALPWIIFFRDQDRFQREFPNLVIVRRSTHTSIAYLLSGGFTCGQLVPDVLIPTVRIIDAALCRLSPCLGMFYLISLRKEVAGP